MRFSPKLVFECRNWYLCGTTRFRLGDHGRYPAQLHGRRTPLFEENRIGRGRSVCVDRASSCLPLVPRRSVDSSRPATRFSQIQDPSAFRGRHRLGGWTWHLRIPNAALSTDSSFAFLHTFRRTFALGVHSRRSGLHQLR